MSTDDNASSGTTVLDDDADGSAGEHDSDERAGTRSEKPSRERKPSGATAIAAVLAVLLVAGAVVAGVMWDEGRRTEQRGQLAVGTARHMAVALVTVNSDTADQDVREILDGAVGNFGKVFSENLDSYVDIVRRGNVRTTGEAASAGLQKLDGTTARVLVAIKAKVTNDQVPQGEDRTYRMNLEMAEQPDGRWLAKNVEFVP